MAGVWWLNDNCYDALHTMLYISDIKGHTAAPHPRTGGVRYLEPLPRLRAVRTPSEERATALDQSPTAERKECAGCSNERPDGRAEWRESGREGEGKGTEQGALREKKVGCRE